MTVQAGKILAGKILAGKILAGFEIMYDCPARTPMLLVLDVHPERAADIEGEHGTRFDRDVQPEHYQDGFGNNITRILAPEGLTTLTAKFVIRDHGLPAAAPGAVQQPVETLPQAVLVYLLGSRYCDTDRLSDVAWALFGGAMTGWDRVQAICRYTQDRVTFDPADADATRTAWGAHQGRRGVDRDFIHLAMALCRCMNIPARYCTGYLGHIGVSVTNEPVSFGAWFETFLDGRWHIFDARHATPRPGRILMARGRDATDVAPCTTFGPCTLAGLRVTTRAVPA